jgi:hydrogenase-4 component F
MPLQFLILIPVVVAVGCLILRPCWIQETLNVAGFAAHLALAIYLVFAVLENGVVTEWGGFLRADALSAWMVLLISVVTLSSVVYARAYFRRELVSGEVTLARFREFYVLTPLFAGAMSFVVILDNLGVMWVALEVTAMSAVLLVALYNRKTSVEAAWKYVILGSFGLVLALFGTIFTYASAVKSGATTFNWSQLLEIAGKLDPQLMKLAFVFLLIGYGTKAGLAPMHTWLPDAHSQAPTPTSAMLSGVSLKVAIYALLRFHILASACLQTPFSRTLLLMFGLVSMLLAGPFILVQRNLKRLFAYSSLEHMGLICAGLALNTKLTIFGALLHMGYHALTKPALFFASGNISQQYHSLEFRRIGSGLGKSMPATAFLLAIAAMAIAGLPPFGLFTTELLIISGGFASNQVLASSLALVALIIVFCGILKQMAGMLLGEPEQNAGREKPSLVPMLALALPLVLLIGLSFRLPGSAQQLLEQAAQIITTNVP